jgi:large subunit ribosomal protein L4
MQLQTLTATGKQGKLTVSDAIFAASENDALIGQAVRVYLSNERQGTAKVKTRAEVERTKKKMYKQKGTGGARHGARSAPIFVGGGVTHGPTGGQNWSLTMPVKQKKKALIVALSWQAEQIRVVDEVEETSGKTKVVFDLLEKVAPAAKKVLIVVSKKTIEVERAIKNLQGVTMIQASDVTALDIVRSNMIVATTAAIKVLETRLSGFKDVNKAEVNIHSKAIVKPAKTKRQPRKVAAKK